MADENHLEILKNGVEAWNQWKEMNRGINPDFFVADLSNADLSNANFSNANFSLADLSNADLSNAKFGDADLSNAKLGDADLSNASLYRVKLFRANLESANLESANLIRVRALGTNFEGATLTGVCIEDWNINRETNLNNVICDYIYLKGNYSRKEKKWVFSDRIPHDPNKIFAPGEFTKRYQKILETVDIYFDDGVDWQAFLVSFNKLQIECDSDELSINSFENKGNVDLIFAEGIEWTAFLESFQQLQAEVNSEELSIQAIEKKSGGVFVVRLEVPQEANKAEIEKYIRQEYDTKVKVIEASYQKQLQLKNETIEAKNETIQELRQKGTDMLEVARIMSSFQQNTIINNSPNMTPGNIYNTENAGILHNEKGDILGNAKVGGKINEDGQPK